MNIQLLTGLLTAGIGYPIVAAVAYFSGYFFGFRKALEQQRVASEVAIEVREKIEEDVTTRSDEQLKKDMDPWFRD